MQDLSDEDFMDALRKKFLAKGFKLKQIGEMLKARREPSDMEKLSLGNDISAQDSVPAAIFCYLYARNKNNSILGLSDDSFIRTIQV